MAFDLGRILALSLFFLAAISIEQTKSQENSTNTEVDTEYDQDVLFDVPENPHEKFNQSFYQRAQSYTASNWRKMTAGTVLNMTLKVTSFIYYVFSVEILHFAKNFHQRFDDFFRARFYFYLIRQKKKFQKTCQIIAGIFFFGFSKLKSNLL